MDFEEVVLNRRSIRKFTKDDISDSTIDDILKSAMYAPSARNQQPWHFFVIKKREVLDKIADNIEHAKMCRTANVCIVVCSYIQTDMQKLYWVQDCSAATQNILLSAKNNGLGSVWCGVYPREAKVKFVSELLELSENMIPLSLIAIGYPDEQKITNDRFDKSKITYID